MASSAGKVAAGLAVSGVSAVAVYLGLSEKTYSGPERTLPGGNKAYRTGSGNTTTNDDKVTDDTTATNVITTTPSSSSLLSLSSSTTTTTATTTTANAVTTVANKYASRHQSQVLAGRRALTSASGPVARVETAFLQANPDMEDRHSACTLSDGSVFVSVFDGHAGWRCADTLAAILPSYANAAVVAAAEGDASVKALSDNAAWAPALHVSQKGGAPNGLAGALQAAFLAADWDIVHTMPERALETRSQPLIQKYVSTALAGACASVCIVSADGLELTTANTGDCRAVLGCYRESSCDGDGAAPTSGRWGALPLSRDQTAESPEEVLRLRAEHPKEEFGTVVQQGRVLGGLQPARTFGDSSYKWPAQFGGAIGVPMPRNNLTPPYVTARPEVSLTAVKDNDAFIILASDGLWDVVSSTEAVAEVGAYIQANTSGGSSSSHGGSSADRQQQQPDDSMTAADRLLALALEKYANLYTRGDVNKLLDIPPPNSRNVRDDITVSVVHLRSRSNVMTQDESDSGNGTDMERPQDSESTQVQSLPVCDPVAFWGAHFEYDAAQLGLTSNDAPQEAGTQN